MFRLVLGESASDRPPKVVEKHVEVVALATGIGVDGSIAEDAVLRSSRALERLARVIDAAPAHAVAAVATGALRLARNAGEVRARLESALRQPIEVIAAAREAELALRGATGVVPRAEQVFLLDVGGSTTEFVHRAAAGAPPVARSFDVGVITLSERAGDDAAMRAIADAEFAAYDGPLPPRGCSVIAAGGAAVALTAHRDGKSFLTFVGDSTLSLGRAELDALYRRFMGAPAGERARSIGISESHAALVPAGYALLCAAMDRLRVDAVIPTGMGVSEGLFLERAAAWSASP